MQIFIAGKGLDVGQSMTEYMEEALTTKIKKYFERATEANVVLTKEAHLYTADVHVNEGTGKNSFVKARGESTDVYAAFDAALEKIEKQLRRYKRKLKNHHADKEIGAAYDVTKYVLSNEGEEVSEEENPLIIAEKQTAIEELTVSDAVMRMHLMGLPALMFINKKTGSLDMVYNREDGNVSWVESRLQAVSEKANAA